MKKFYSIAVCLVFIVNLANLAYGRTRKDVDLDNSSVSGDTSASSTVSQPSAASTSQPSQSASGATLTDKGSQSSGSMSSKTDNSSSGAQVSQTPDTSSVKTAVADTSQTPKAKAKRGPRSKVSKAAGAPTTAASAATDSSAASMDSEAKAKADALSRAEAKLQGSAASAPSAAVSQPEMGAAAASVGAGTASGEGTKAYADADRARAEAEAKAAEAETAAAAARAQKNVKTTPAVPLAKGAFAPFYVYKDQGARGNHYIPSGWMGDYGDLKVNPGCTTKVHSGTTSVQIKYTAKMAQNAGWCGVYWQNPPNNWGDKKGGFNLTGAKSLTFWACGEKGGEVISEFKVGGISGEYPDSDSASIGPIELSKKWQNYTIELTGRDLTNIIGGFCFSASRDDNPEGFTIYIDDIVFE